jgi:hypothetical protein
MGGGCACDNNLVKNLFNNLNMMTQKNNCSDKDKKSKQVIHENGGNIATSNKTYHILSNIIENSPDRKSMRKRYSYFPNNENIQVVNFTNMQNMGNEISNYDGKNSPNNRAPFYNQNNNNNEEKNKIYNGNSLSTTRNLRLKMNTIKEEEEYNYIPENSNKVSYVNNVNLISENNSKHNHIIQKKKKMKKINKRIELM